MNKSHQQRIMQRRSPPRLMTVGVEPVGTITPTKRILQPYIPKQKVERIFAAVLESIVALPAMDHVESKDTRTTVEKEEKQGSYPRISVQVNTDPSLKMQEGHQKSPQRRVSKRSQTRSSLTTEGKSSRALRAKLTNQAVEGTVSLSVGTRQTWKFTERYDPVVHGEDVCVKLSGNQAIRVTFHKSGGTILQDIEIAPDEIGFELGVPPSSRYMTVEGLGCLPAVLDKTEIGTGAVELRYPHGELSPIGFDASSHIQQVGLFRYLSRGMFIEAKESLSSKVSGKAITFTAGDALARVDDLRLYCSSSIRTLVVILRTLPEVNPSLQFKADGVKVSSEPLVIQRKNKHAFFFQVIQNDEVEAPAIFDVDTDETTDVVAVVGYRGQYNQIFDYYKGLAWNRLVHAGPLSHSGQSNLSFNFGVRKVKDEQPTESKKTIEKPIIQPVISKTATASSNDINDSPLVAELSVKALEAFQLDLARYASDEDELDTLRFELISGPKFVSVHETGWLQGTADNDDSGVHTLIVRVIDSGSLHADARFLLQVEPKVVNRAPVWKPAVRQRQPEKDIESNKQKRSR